MAVRLGRLEYDAHCPLQVSSLALRTGSCTTHRLDQCFSSHDFICTFSRRHIFGVICEGSSFLKFHGKMLALTQNGQIRFFVRTIELAVKSQEYVIIFWLELEDLTNILHVGTE